MAAAACLSLAGAIALPTVQADTTDNGPHGSEHTHFYLWRTTLTVGESSGQLGYDSSFGSLSTGAKFNYPPWSPPHKHHVDSDYEFTVRGLYIDASGAEAALVVQIGDADNANNIDVGNLTLWIGNTSVPLPDIGGNRST